MLDVFRAIAGEVTVSARTTGVAQVPEAEARNSVAAFEAHCGDIVLPCFSNERGNFSEVRGANVLIYFPHGLGDWIQFGVVLENLEPSNQYWMTRFGDDSVSLIEHCENAKPIYLGHNGTQDEATNHSASGHFGVTFQELNGSPLTLRVPWYLRECLVKHKIDVVLWPAFAETGGRRQPPYHSKARSSLSHLASKPLWPLLASPLASSINFATDGFVTAWVEARLRQLLSPGDRLCVIARTGYTSPGKNWGHRWREDLPLSQQLEGQECRDFMTILRRIDSKWKFLVMEDYIPNDTNTVTSRDLCAYSYAEVFGAAHRPNIPLGLTMKVVARNADLCVGVPTGPYHLCMLHPSLPTIGLWIEHLPSWFDEPKSASIHIVSRNVTDCGLASLPGSFSGWMGLHFEMMLLNTRTISADQVIAACETLLRA